MNNNINILDELYKGCDMGINALDIILEKVDEHSFKELLEKERLEYVELSNKIDELYREYTTGDIHEIGKMTKVMSWYGIQKDTILDSSISKFSELLINGTTMGIIEGRKILNNKTMDKKVHKLCNLYVAVQEKYVDKLKEYL